MSLIVKTTARLISGMIFLYGIYIVLHGHLTPGGGFAGGVIMAGAFVLLIIAEDSDATKLGREKEMASLLEATGVFLFWFVGVLGLILGGVFLINFLGIGTPFHLVSAGTIPLINIAIGIEVGAALVAIFIALISSGRGED
ncbi:MAG: MnhB domain-containing protein [bacterium]|nr:MnhB domain-containing protein [bacterium]